jgi:hypothetical protein
MLTADPGIQPMYGMEQRYNMLRSFLENSGVKNVNDFLIPPQQVPPQQPDEMQMFALEMQKKQMELQERQVMVTEAKAENDAKIDQMAQDMERMKTMIDLMVKQREIERKEFDSKQRAEIAKTELEMLKSNKPSETKQTQIVSPNS